MANNNPDRYPLTPKQWTGVVMAAAAGTAAAGPIGAAGAAIGTAAGCYAANALGWSDQGPSSSEQG